MVGVTTLSAENGPLSHLKRATAGTEGVHTISRLGDGKDCWEVLQFPRTAVVFGEGEEGLLIHLFSSSLTQVGSDLLQRREAPIFWQIILYFDFQQ